MRNPWLKLPSKPPYVLPADAPHLAVRQAEGLRLEKLPYPFLGNPKEARVCLLSLNPGWRHQDANDQALPGYAEQSLKALRFESDVPFLSLDPRFSTTGGYGYWRPRLRSLIERVGQERVGRRLMLVEFLGYSSRTYDHLPTRLPSQLFAFHLVRDFIARGVPIVVMRSERLWLEGVPELKDYGYIRVRSPRSSHVSPGNLGAEAFESLVSALSEA